MGGGGGVKCDKLGRPLNFGIYNNGKLSGGKGDKGGEKKAGKGSGKGGGGDGGRGGGAGRGSDMRGGGGGGGGGGVGVVAVAGAVQQRAARWHRPHPRLRLAPASRVWASTIHLRAWCERHCTGSRSMTPPARRTSSGRVWRCWRSTLASGCCRGGSTGPALTVTGPAVLGVKRGGAGCGELVLVLLTV